MALSSNKRRKLAAAEHQKARERAAAEHQKARERAVVEHEQRLSELAGKRVAVVGQGGRGIGRVALMHALALASMNGGLWAHEAKPVHYGPRRKK